MKEIKIKIVLIILIFFTYFASAPNLDGEKVLDVNAQLEEARSYYIESDYKIAIDKYQFIIENFPEEYYELALAHYEIGICYYLLENYEKAREYFVLVLQKFANPRSISILSLDLIRKIDQKEYYKRSHYK